jgi:hypothetical protein
MSTFRNNATCSKIVSVKLDNGDEYQVDDDCLRRYLENRFADEAGNVLGVPSETIRAMTKAYAQVQREEKSETNSKNSSNPRNTFAKNKNAKADLVAFKNEFEKREAKTHGWMSAAMNKFLIDRKTLKGILARPENAEK